tara:strand:+ start:363 stop:683 length:321 start_codon:yes stop_codon:yes gene_type:complete
VANFKLKSGNITPFKEMGSTPVKQGTPGGDAGEAIDHWVKYKKAKKGGKLLKNIGKRFLGPLGVALTAYDVVKTIPKVSKATEEGLKKRTKTETDTGFTNPGVRKI